MAYKKRKTRRFRRSKKAQEYMNLDIQAISGGSYKKRRTKKFRPSKKAQKYMNLDIETIS